MSKKLYDKYGHMQQRCHNKNDKFYLYYGARGIKVCDEWLGNPKEFVKWSLENGYEDGLEIERIDNEKGYSPDNCTFVTHQMNMCNRRKQSNNTSGYRGVYKHGKSGYRSMWFFKGMTKRLGTHNTSEKAALWRDVYNLARGGFLPFNFKQLEKVGG